jgi:hypothetical protein
MKNRCLVVTATLCLLLAVPAMADTLFVGTTGSLSASANFHSDAGNLVITLTNTGIEASDPAQALTGVYFNFPGNVALSPQSVVIPAGSSLLNWDTCSVKSGNNTTNPCTASTTNVGGEFAYSNNLGSGSVWAGANQGVSSAGLGVFGGSNFASGVNLSDPKGIDGPNFSIVNGLASGANGGITSVPTINNSVVITLAGVGINFDTSTINHVWFQYGTATTDAHFCADGSCTPPRVPEPGSMLLLGTGSLAAAGFLRRRLR